MILRLIILYTCIASGVTSEEVSRIKRCLTGYMTDVQSWVSQNGTLTIGEEKNNYIDLSASENVEQSLQQYMTLSRKRNYFVKYLSMARCKLHRVPNVFVVKYSQGYYLSDTVEYLTLYGNEFDDANSESELYEANLNASQARNVNVDQRLRGHDQVMSSEAMWSAGFRNIKFSRLRELDLRACSIQTLNANTFEDMSQLEALYLGENNILYVYGNTFSGLHNLLHLDLSRNTVTDSFGISKTLIWKTLNVFDDLKNLSSLDLSFTQLSQDNIRVFSGLGNKLVRLSICETGLSRLRDDLFSGTSLKYLDVSGNSGILSSRNVLRGLEKTLQVLYADNVLLRRFDIFKNFEALQILKLSNNEINSVTTSVAKNLKNLKILSLDVNRITTWLSPTFSLMPQLDILSLRSNNINVISEQLIEDLKNISYVGLSNNPFICCCLARLFYELAARNEHKFRNRLVYAEDVSANHTVIDFHTGFDDFERIIEERTIITTACETEACNDEIDDMEMDVDFVIFDYDPLSYKCLFAEENKYALFYEVEFCGQLRNMGYDKIINGSRNKLFALILIPILLLPMLIFIYTFRKNFRYCLITARNSAMLSMINKKKAIDDNTIFNYDVFVSYCNEDRSWVLDYLLPHLERDCSVSVCMHERDFQVGLSILENIVSCMDRSKSIMLVISRQFLLSQWCQFEMHLAQHRLLETRREDLTLVLLEDIPRKLRPNTLHYLMLTKTYIVWPKEPAEQASFWRRLKKTMVPGQLKQSDNVSLA